MANRILLADDSITIQKVVNLTFADEGFEVVAVSNGDQAERRLAEVQPDLVLADIFMPGKNGYELCEAIKNNPAFQHIPVILLVGAFEPFDQAEAHRVKADAHLTKPFESRTLVDTVRKLISASSGRPRTGPLPVAEAPVEPLTPVLPVAAPAAPRPAPHMAQPFDLDLPAMGTPEVPMATMPLNYAFEANEAPLSMSVDAPAKANSHRTDDLSFVDNEPPFEAFGLDDLFSEPQGGQAAQSLAASQPAIAVLTETAQESSPRGVPSAFGYAAEEMLLDLDQPAPITPRTTQEPFAFDIDVREPASVDASGMQPDEPRAEVADAPEVLKTTMLTQPAPTSPVESAINTNPLEEPHAHTVSMPVQAADLSVDESGLFNLDDPLGDVLDEGTAAAAPVEAPAPSESFVDYEVEMPAAPMAAAVVTEMAAPPAEAPDSETGFGFTPVEEVAAEPLPHTSEAKFTTSSMWSSEGARFAAIDIEATPVEEPAESMSASTAKAEAPAPFGLSESASAYTTQPEPVAEAAAPVIEEAAPPAAASTVELSPASMDEIVRRVVAQLSDSVVREIAWEVVPDCVERVIKAITAQEAAKR